MIASMIEVVANVIVLENQLLVFQWRLEVQVCSYQIKFSGGKMKENELQTDNLIVELKEELDLDVRVDEWITIMENRCKDFSIKMQCYLVRLESFNCLFKRNVNYSHRFLVEATT